MTASGQLQITNENDLVSIVWKEGFLTKEGRVVRNWKRRYFILKEGKLGYYNPKDRTDKKGEMLLVGCSVRSLGSDAETDITSTASAYESFAPPQTTTPSQNAATNATTNTGEAPPSSSSTLSASSSNPSQKPAVKRKAHFSVPSTDVDSDRNQNSTGPGDDDMKDDAQYVFKFCVEGSGRMLNMAAFTDEDRRDWIQKIQDCINVENYINDCHKFEVKPLIGVLNVLADHNVKHLVVQHEMLTLDSARALSEVLRRNIVLTRLYITHAGLTDGFMQTLAAGLSHNDILTHVDLSFNRISDDGIADLTDGLYINISLQHLVVSHNEIGDVGAVHLSDLLRANVSIRSVNSSYNRIGSHGAQAFARAIASSTLLEELDIGNNQLSNEGALHIAEALKRNKTLQRLGLSHNGIGDEGICALCDAISNNKSLIDIDFAGNCFEKLGASALVAALRDHQTIAHVDVSDNKRLAGDGGGLTVMSETLKSRYSVTKMMVRRGTVISQ